MPLTARLLQVAGCRPFRAFAVAGTFANSFEDCYEDVKLAHAAARGQLDCL